MATFTSTTRSGREATQSSPVGAPTRPADILGPKVFNTATGDMPTANMLAKSDAPSSAILTPAMRLIRGARRGISTILFGSDSVRILDMRDVNAYYRTTEG